MRLAEVTRQQRDLEGAASVVAATVNPVLLRRVLAGIAQDAATAGALPAPPPDRSRSDAASAAADEAAARVLSLIQTNAPTYSVYATLRQSAIEKEKASKEHAEAAEHAAKAAEKEVRRRRS